MERADLAGKKMPVVVGWTEDAGRCWMDRRCRSLLDGKKIKNERVGRWKDLMRGQEGRSSLELVR